jgi:hypothetical protein
MQPTVSTILQQLPPYKDKWITITDRQDVHDIITDMCKSHQHFASYYDRFAMDFWTGDIDTTCDNIYWFLKNNISYREEKELDQTTALPTGILTRGYGDCKHYASFAGGVLDSIARQTGIPIHWKYCFASYEQSQRIPYHVFVVVDTDSGPVWIDPTPGASESMPVWVINKKPKCLNCSVPKSAMGSVGKVISMGAIPVPYTNLSASTFNAEVANGTISLTPDQVVTALGSNGPATQAAANNFANTCKQMSTQAQALYNNNLLTQYLTLVQAAPPGSPNYLLALAAFSFAYAASSYGWSLNPSDGYTYQGFYDWLQINNNAVWQEIYQPTIQAQKNQLSSIISANNLKAVRAIPSLLTAIATGNPSSLIAQALGQVGGLVTTTAPATVVAPASGLAALPGWVWIAAAVGLYLIIEE